MDGGSSNSYRAFFEDMDEAVHRDLEGNVILIEAFDHYEEYCSLWTLMERWEAQQQQQ